MFISSCGLIDNKFVIKNNRPATISYLLAGPDQTAALKYFGPELKKTSKNKALKNQGDYLMQGMSAHIAMMDSWDNYFKNSDKRDSTYLYVIDSVNMGKDTATLRTSALISQYHVTLEYMKASNWVFEVK